MTNENDKIVDEDFEAGWYDDEDDSAPATPAVPGEPEGDGNDELDGDDGLGDADDTPPVGNEGNGEPERIPEPGPAPKDEPSRTREIAAPVRTSADIEREIASYEEELKSLTPQKKQTRALSDEEDDELRAIFGDAVDDDDDGEPVDSRENLRNQIKSIEVENKLNERKLELENAKRGERQAALLTDPLTGHSDYYETVKSPEFDDWWNLPENKAIRDSFNSSVQEDRFGDATTTKAVRAVDRFKAYQLSARQQSDKAYTDKKDQMDRGHQRRVRDMTLGVQGGTVSGARKPSTPAEEYLAGWNDTK